MCKGGLGQILPRSGPGVLSEGIAEVALIGKSHGQCGLGRRLAAAQQLSGPIDAPQGAKLMGREAGFALKDP